MASLNRSIRITAAISLALVFMQCVLSAIVFVSFRAAVRGNVEKQQSALVGMMARELDGKIDQHLRLITDLAKETPAEAFSGGGRGDAFLALHRETVSVFEQGLVLLDAQGTVVACLPVRGGMRRGADLSYRDYFREVLARKAPVVSEPYAGISNGDPMVIFAAPVLDGSGKVRGVLGGALNLLHNNFLGNIAHARIGERGYLYLIGKNRRIIVHPDRSRIMNEIAPGGNVLLDRALAGFDGSGEGRNSRGVDALSSFASLGRAPWLLAASFPVNEAYAPLRSASWKLLLALSFTILCSCAALHAIAQRMRGEIARRADAEDSARLLLDSVREGVVGVDRCGVVDFVNRSALDLFGYDSAADFLGRDVRELLHADGRDWLSCDRERCRIHPAVAGGEALHCENETLRRGDGSSFTADLSCTPVMSRGTRRGAVMTVRDVSERRAIQERLRLQGEALEAAANSILITGADHRIIWVNPSFTRQTGYSPEEALGQNPMALLSGREDGELLEELKHTIASKRPWHGEVVTARKDGTLYDEDVTITPVLDERGEATHYIGIMQDISERKWAQQALLQSNLVLEDANARLVEANDRAKELALKAERASAAKSQFLANMSHEIRTPMNAIIGVGHLLRGTALTPEQERYLQTLTLSADSLLGIIDDVLDLAKIEAGKVEIDRVRFSPEGVVSGVTTVFAERIRAKGLALRVNVDAAVPRWLQGDPLRLTQILNNLMANAVKFTAAGEIGLAVSLAGQVADGIILKFAVSDTGIGIRDEDQAQLFQPFTQVDGSVTRTYGGTGLGLDISRRLTTLMGGRIWCESVPGKGSTFHFAVPLVLDGGTAERGEAPVAGRKSRFNGERVLLVEDNAFNQQVAVALLENGGLRVTIANNGSEALKLVAEHDFDVVLMDIQMPVMDGLTAARRIRSMEKPEAAALPIVAVSANAMEHDIEQSRAAGMNHHITKPYTPQSLYGAIALSLGRGNAPDPAKLDVQAGIRQIGGNSQLYRDLLDRFDREYDARGREIRVEVQRGNLQRAGHMAHSLKGVAGFLAATRLHAAAQRLETALERESAEIEEALASFEEELAVTLELVRGELREGGR